MPPMEKENLIAALLSGTLPEGVDLQGFDLSGADLRELNFPGLPASGVNLATADLTGAVLDGADLSKADISGAKLGGASLKNANLSETKLHRTELTKTDLAGANLEKAQIDTVKFFETNLDGASLKKTHLNQTLFQGAILQNTNMSGSLIEQTKFKKTNLRNADISRSLLARVSIISCDARKMVSQKGRFNTVQFGGCRLDQSYFKESSFDNSVFVKTIGEGMRCISCNFKNTKFEDCDFTGADLSYSMFSDGELARTLCTKCNLTGIFMDNMKLSESSLVDAQLTGSRLVKVDLSLIDLSHCNMESADFTEVKLVDANLEGVVAQGAHLKQADLTRANLSNINLSQAELLSACFASSTMNNADLTGADCTNADFSDTQITGAKLEDTILQGAVVEGRSSEVLSEVMLDRSGLKDGQLAQEVKKYSPIPEREKKERRKKGILIGAGIAGVLIVLLAILWSLGVFGTEEVFTGDEFRGIITDESGHEARVMVDLFRQLVEEKKVFYFRLTITLTKFKKLPRFLGTIGAEAPIQAKGISATNDITDLWIFDPITKQPTKLKLSCHSRITMNLEFEKIECSFKSDHKKVGSLDIKRPFGKKRLKQVMKPAD